MNIQLIGASESGSFEGGFNRSRIGTKRGGGGGGGGGRGWALIT